MRPSLNVEVLRLAAGFFLLLPFTFLTTHLLETRPFWPFTYLGEVWDSYRGDGALAASFLEGVVLGFAFIGIGIYAAGRSLIRALRHTKV